MARGTRSAATRTPRCLAPAPFLDRLELAVVSGAPDRTTHDAVTRLERQGLAAPVRHATDLMASTRRLYVTDVGLRRLARDGEVGLKELLHAYPVSRYWRRILLERLDAVAAVYRLASAIAAVGGPLHFRWYRRAPLDVAITLADGRFLGVIRQGLTSDRTGFSKRVWRLLDGPLPDAVLVLTPDAMRLRHARVLLRRAPQRVLLTLERDAILTSPDDKIWRLPSVSTVLSLRDALSSVKHGGGLREERPLARPLVSSDLRVPDSGFDVPDYLLPAVLKPAEKRTLDLLADWPWITPKDLSGLLGVSPARTSQLTIPLTGAGLACRVEMEGRQRLALTDWGLAVLARRDRTSVGKMRKQWSVTSGNGAAPVTWRTVPGTRSRPLARTMAHTEATHWFMAQLARQARAGPYRLGQIDPPHRAVRHFRHEGKLRSIHPDAFGVLHKGRVMWPFFLEWERRAVRPSTMAARLSPYLRYFLLEAAPGRSWGGAPRPHRLRRSPGGGPVPHGGTVRDEAGSCQFSSLGLPQGGVGAGGAPRPRLAQPRCPKAGRRLRVTADLEHARRRSRAASPRDVTEDLCKMASHGTRIRHGRRRNRGGGGRNPALPSRSYGPAPLAAAA